MAPFVSLVICMQQLQTSRLLLHRGGFSRQSYCCKGNWASTPSLTSVWIQLLCTIGVSEYEEGFLRFVFQSSSMLLAHNEETFASSMKVCQYINPCRSICKIKDSFFQMRDADAVIILCNKNCQDPALEDTTNILRYVICEMYIVIITSNFYLQTIRQGVIRKAF